MENDDTRFARALFQLIAFLMTFGVLGYGIYLHNWSLVLGVVLGSIGTALSIAVKESKKP